MARDDWGPLSNEEFLDYLDDGYSFEALAELFDITIFMVLHKRQQALDARANYKEPWE